MTMTTIKLTRKITIEEVEAILDWLKIYIAEYEFTGKGMELLTFKTEEDATAFKLRFAV